MNNKHLAIVIPTVRYTEYFDKTLQSCLNLKLEYEIEIIVSVNNCNFERFVESKYFNDKKITWKCIGSETIPMADSINRAIGFSSADWIFILSDDDLILDGFMAGVDLVSQSKSFLYATRINIIDENGSLIRDNSNYQKKVYGSDEAIELFFEGKIHNHISLLLFHRDLLKKVGDFKLYGYPNGYYIDTVFHGKALANCEHLYTAEQVVFSRRETSTQGSSKFYFDKKVNGYFNIIVDDFFKDDKFKDAALKKFGTKSKFYKFMIQKRFYTEWSKLNKPVYNQSQIKKMNFLINYFLYWNTGHYFKYLSVLYILKLQLRKCIPQTLIHFLKKAR